MSAGYVAVQWNPYKRRYDAFVCGAVVLYLGMFGFVGKLLFRGEHALSDEVLALRALGSCAFLMLSVVLCIGPAARLDRRLLPILYNRRHLGVATFLVAALHGALALGYYHGFGRINPLLSLLTTNTSFTSLRAFPFQLPGAAALLILFLMAATSHDFWNRNLSARLWKWLHMLVYPAYGLVVMHVALGALQAQRTWWLAALVCACAATVTTLHLVAGSRERAADRGRTSMIEADATAWLEVGRVDEIPPDRARIACAPGGERIAVFRYDGRISAISNVCAHQGGPLGEGKVVDGCVTCPWHGWQYRPADGQAPPPFTERVATFRVRVDGRRVLVDPNALPPGTPVEPAFVEESCDA
ncbi:MAG: ferric reductase-like transmembrane domain-containing protein [Planctomycetes bacterium]|nr:ferric reductase-like transmembrane domain-containing protein [Planctomycetota bacterium]